MLLGCYQLLCRPRQFQLKLHTEERRRRAMGMAWPEQLSCSQQWIKLSVSWITQDVCSWLITTQCLLYSILYLEGKKKHIYLYHITSMLWFFLCCYGNLPFPFTITHMSKNGIHMNKHLIPKPYMQNKQPDTLSPVRKNYIRFCLCESWVYPEVIQYSLPPRGSWS